MGSVGKKAWEKRKDEFKLYTCTNFAFSHFPNISPELLVLLWVRSRSPSPMNGTAVGHGIGADFLGPDPLSDLHFILPQQKHTHLYLGNTQ